MTKTGSIAAYLAWLVALAAILMPPALAAAGSDAIASAQDAIFATLDEGTDPLVVAQLNAAGTSGRG
jgi:hypothetical protein